MRSLKSKSSFHNAQSLFVVLFALTDVDMFHKKMNRDDQDNPYGMTQSRFCAQRWNPSACMGYVTLQCNPEAITMS